MAFKFYSIFYLVFMVCMLGACTQSGSQNAESIDLGIKHVKYYVRFMEGNHELQAEVTFQSDTGNIAIPEGVYLKENKMLAKQLPKLGLGYRYIQQPATLESAYVFNLKYTPTATLSDTIHFPNLEDFKLATPKISLSTGGLLTWTGNSLSQEEEMVLIFQDVEDNIFTVNHVGITRGAQLEIRPEHIATLSKGKASLSVVHKKMISFRKGKQVYMHRTELYKNPFIFELVD